MTREEYKAKLKGLHPQMDCDLKWKYTQEYIASLEARINELDTTMLQIDEHYEDTHAEALNLKDKCIAELEAENAAMRENAIVWNVFDIDNPNTYPQTVNMYLTLSMPGKNEYREPDTNSTYDVLWWDLYSEEFWLTCGVTHWAELPDPL